MPNHRVIMFENDFQQWDFAAPYYKSWRARKNKVLPLVTHYSKDLKTEHRGADKDSRIFNLVHPHQTGTMPYVEELKDNPDHITYKNTNYLRFGKHKNTKLDGLDVLATCYIMIWSYVVTGDFKSLKKRKFEQNQMKEWFR